MPTSLISSFCTSGQMFAASFLQIPTRVGHPCPWLYTSRYRACYGLAPIRESSCWANNKGGAPRSRPGVPPFSIKAESAIRRATKPFPIRERRSWGILLASAQNIMTDSGLSYHQTSHTGMAIALQENQIKAGSEATQTQSDDILPDRISP